MFDWFKDKKDMDKKDNNVIEFPEPKVVPKMPQTVPPIPPKPQAREHYRVGKRDDDMTTLTLMSHDGYNVTLAMNEDACEQLIKLLRATYE